MFVIEKYFKFNKAHALTYTVLNFSFTFHYRPRPQPSPIQDKPTFLNPELHTNCEITWIFKCVSLRLKKLYNFAHRKK